MFEEPLFSPIQSPCRNCTARHFSCWSGCDRYIAYRSALDKIHAQDQARRASRPRAKSQPYKSIEQCVREAKALGISYGQFVARGLDRM